MDLLIGYGSTYLFPRRYKKKEIEKYGEDEWKAKNNAKAKAFRLRRIAKLKAKWAQFVQENPDKQLQDITPAEVREITMRGSWPVQTYMQKCI